MSGPSLQLSVSELLAHVRRPEVIRAMHEFYAEADREIAEQDPSCWSRGECCRFGEFGHRLYVTTLEIIYYLATGNLPPPVTADACPHSLDGRCMVRHHRPLGCRVFYCDPHAQQWQGPLTERRLTRLRAMHEELNVPYEYVDWMAVMRAISEQEQ
jgi:hypothetical protein